MALYPKPNLTKFFIIQIISLLVISTLAFVLNAKLSVFLSAFLGGFSIMLPNFYFAKKFFAFKNPADGSGMKKLLAFEAGKILFAIICLAFSLILLLYFNLLVPKYFLGTYIFMLFLNIILSARLKNRF